jgi:Fuc2NAc and GlcNAc transferase
MTVFWWLLPSAACVAFVLTWLLKRYALARRLVDVPNPRGSHRVSTPRGGGLAMVLSFLAGLAVLAGQQLIPLEVAAAIGGAGAWVALVGFIDDHKHVPAIWRLLAHFIAAAWILYWMASAPGPVWQGETLLPLWLISSFAVLCVVWFVNLYNFMDGIDGLASVEAITVCLGGIVLLWAAEPGGSSWVLPALLLAAVAGFFYWNYPPARIFMGDTGSGFLGVVIAVFCVQAAGIGADTFWGWVILPGVFVVDATVALVRRALRGQKLHEAHRSHAYQYAARLVGAHRPVSLCVGLINLLWLGPMAVLVGLDYLNGLAGLVLAYTPLVGLAFYFKSGAPELQEVE